MGRSLREFNAIGIGHDRREDDARERLRRRDRFGVTNKTHYVGNRYGTLRAGAAGSLKVLCGIRF